MLALPQGAAERADGLHASTHVAQGMPGQERREVRRDGDGAHARSAAAVRDTKRLVQIDVTDIGTHVARDGRDPP